MLDVNIHGLIFVSISTNKEAEMTCSFHEGLLHAIVKSKDLNFGLQKIRALDNNLTMPFLVSQCKMYGTSCLTTNLYLPFVSSQ